jgi:hypothetical protein
MSHAYNQLEGIQRMKVGGEEGGVNQIKKKSIKQFRSSHFRTDRLACFRETYFRTRDVRVMNKSSILPGIKLFSG